MMYGSWDIKCKGQSFMSFYHFFPLWPSQQPKKSKLKKKLKKNTRRYYHFTIMYHKWWWYVWFLRYQARHTEFFVLLGHFLPFYPTNNLENQTSEKMKQNTGDIIISHMSTINKNHMIYDFWDMECNRQNFFSFDHFLSFYPSPSPFPLTIQRIKILKK